MKDEGSIETAKGQAVMRPTKGDQVRAKGVVSQVLPIAPRDVRSPLEGFLADLAALDRNAASNTLGWPWVSVARFAGEPAT
jgi:hypothetical protein